MSMVTTLSHSMSAYMELAVATALILSVGRVTILRPVNRNYHVHPALPSVTLISSNVWQREPLRQHNARTSGIGAGRDVTTTAFTDNSKLKDPPVNCVDGRAFTRVDSVMDRYVLSLSAATPGNSSPERNSNVAPPPVEMCVIWSATPARVTAETESPPPTITVAPRCAASETAFATPIVPSSKGGSSNTPIGPFQMIIFASCNADAKWPTVSTPMSMPTRPMFVNSIGIVLATIFWPLIGS